jgi:group I intron endonuclease
MYAIYIITNLLNAKQYVGITKDLKKRWGQHKTLNGSAPALHAALKKYGKENFALTHIADAFDSECACAIEQMLIKDHNTLSPNGYNLTLGGEGVHGIKLATSHKEKIKSSVHEYIASLSESEKKKKYTAKNVVSRAGSKQKENSKKKTSESTFRIKVRISDLENFDFMEYGNMFYNYRISSVWSAPEVLR